MRRTTFLTGSLVAALALAASAQESSFYADFQKLTSTPHRISGTPEGQAAAAYLERRLRDMGIKDVFILDVPVAYPRVARCQLTVDSVTVDLLPMLPNAMVPPVTPGDGLVAPLRYVGKSFGTGDSVASVENAIAVMDYDCDETWRSVFMMGARGIVFLGDSVSTPWYAKSVAPPIDLVRLYAPVEAQQKINLRTSHAQAKVVSHIPWRRSTGRNILAFIPGTNPSFASATKQSEMLVLSANYDSYGEVPLACNSARGAANVAAVLEAAAFFRDNRPKRDVVIMLVDAQSNFHRGTFSVFSALTRDKGYAETLAREHIEELAYVNKFLSALSTVGSTPVTSADIVRRLMNNAENRRNDAKQEAASVRFQISESANKGELVAKRDRLEGEIQKWDDALKALSKNTTAGIPAILLAELRATTENDLRGRARELDQLIKIDEQEKILRTRLGSRWISLNASYSFSDQGPTWGPVVGDATVRNLAGDAKHGRPSTEDNPGHYLYVLRALRDAASTLPVTSGCDLDVLRGNAPTSQFIPGNYVFPGYAAGIFGFYNVGFMTYHDGRLRDGHPADNAANLDWARIQQQAQQATHLLLTVANGEAISLPQVFQNVSSTLKERLLPRWDGTKATGYSAELMVSGSLAENRPAAGAMIAFAPAFVSPTDCPIRGFSRFPMELVDANGKYGITGYPFAGYKGTLYKVAAIFDSLGSVSAIMNTKSRPETERVQLFQSRGFGLSTPMYNKVDPLKDADTRVLQASANAPFRDDKSYFGSYDDFTCFYIPKFSSDQSVKIFQPVGALFLAASRQNPYGKGFPLEGFVYPPAVDRITAEDMWELNQTRLGLVRSKGVTDVELEVLHNRAKQLQEKADQAPGVREKQALFAQSATISRLVYNPVKMLMNDLIKAIVILLLLAIPFAFALERLLICSNTVYGRLAGFVGFFLATFILLYFMHPGFSIAATPVIVFLAFAIIVLTSLVIYIMMRKFRTELMAFQGKVTSMHNVEISRMGTMIAAVNMGMSTMRRRPTRTFLTCVTVVMLTFTILCFASLTSSVGVRSYYEGPPSGDVAASFLLRKVDYGKIRFDVLGFLHGREGKTGLLCSQWWMVKTRATDDAFDVCRIATNKSVGIDGVMGVTPEELERWDQLASVFEGDSVAAKQRALRAGGVFLPLMVREQLRLVPGDSIWFNGRRTFFAGIFDAQRLQKIKHLDGRNILPVDFRDPGYIPVSVTSGAAGQVEANASELVQRDFTRLSANQVAITSSDVVRRSGGLLNTISIYPDPSIDPVVEGKRLAEIAGMPVWTKTKDGVQRMVFANVTQVSGGYALIIPILLGGFIIFGTLLGSITDRQKEIYTFSALGLSPGHVGFLFLAEAGVYAVIGGLGGQLLAQALALGATQLAHLGLIQQPSINFSSTNSIFAIIVVMATVLLSSLYPAYRASKSANPGVQRAWKMPPPQGDVLTMKFPFTVSTYDITGVVSFLAEHFREHGDAGLGNFAAQNVGFARDDSSKGLVLSSLIYLAPFDLGISHEFSLTATPSEIPGIDEISITAIHKSGSVADWKRSNRVFLRELRRQFLLWRTLAPEAIELYRMETLRVLGEQKAA